MKQQKFPIEWNMKVGDKIEINNKKFIVQKIDVINSCYPEHCHDEKIFYLEDNYALIITLEKDQIETKFFKVIKPNEHTKKFEKVELKTLKLTTI